MRIGILCMGSRGDVQPCVAIGRGLSGKGFAVSITAPAEYADLVTRNGMRCQPVSQSLRRMYRTEPGSSRLRENLHQNRLLLKRRQETSPVMDSVLTELWRACQEADVILYNPLTLAGQHMARLLGKPSYMICLQPLVRTGEFPSILFPDYRIPGSWYNRASHAIVEHLAWRFLRPSINHWQARQASGLTSHGKDFRRFHTNEPVIFNGFSSAVVPRPRDWGSRVHITGYWFLDEGRAGWSPTSGLQRFLQSGEPPVGIDFGSMNDRRVLERARLAVRNLLEQGCRVLLFKGGSRLADTDFPADERLHLCDDVPHDWLFPQLSAVLHHGGAGTTAEALRAGIPSLIMPFFFDQFFWARQLHRRGLGPAPLKPGQNLRVGIHRLKSDAACRRRLRAVSERIKTEQGVDNMVQGLVHALGG